MFQLFGLFVTFATVLYLLFKYFTSNFDYWKIRGIKYENPHLVFGNYGEVFLGNSSGRQLVKKLCKKYPNEKLVGLFHTRRPQLLIKDIELIRHVLVKDFDHFTDRSAISNEKTEPIMRNLVFARSEKWRTMRKKLTPAFTSGKLKTMFPLLVEKVDEFQNYISKISKIDPVVDILELVSQMTTDMIGSTIFGIETGAMTNSESPFRKIGKMITKPSRWKSFKIFFKTLFPSLFSFLRMSVHSNEIIKFFCETVNNIVKYREANDYHRNDFVEMLIELKKQNIDHQFDDMTIAAQAYVFFTGGFETSANLLGCAFHEFVNNPEVLKKVFDEIDTVLEKHNGEITYDSISEMSYLDMCIYETLRKYPSLVNIPRVCTKKYTFPDTNVTIDKNIPILIPALRIHYNPEYYPNPHKFIPERFSPEERRRRDPVTFLGFGEGPRNCIGLRLGKIMSIVGIVAVLGKFNIEVCEKSEKKITFNRRSFISTIKNGVWLKLSPRNK